MAEDAFTCRGLTHSDLTGGIVASTMAVHAISMLVTISGCPAGDCPADCPGEAMAACVLTAVTVTVTGVVST